MAESQYIERIVNLIDPTADRIFEARRCLFSSAPGKVGRIERPNILKTLARKGGMLTISIGCARKEPPHPTPLVKSFGDRVTLQ